MVAAPADRPLVVVAGAGSGKTETMAARVSWLVANRLVEPEAILGLTFTRKAASELNERVRLRLGALARHPDTDDGPARAARHRAADRLDLPRLRGGAGRRARPADRGRARRRRARPGHVLGAGRHRRERLDRRHERRPADPADHGRGRAGAGRRARGARHQPGRAARLDGPAGGADRRVRRRPAQEGPLRGRPGDARPAAGAGGAAAAGRGLRGAQAGGRRDRLRRPGRLRRPDRRRRRPRSAAASAPAGRSCCSTSTRTPASGSCACSRRCSGATPATRCWPSATPASRSTAGAGPRPAPSSASPAPSPGCPGRRAERLTLATSWRNDDAVLAVANAVSGMLPPPDQPLPDLAPAPTAGRGAVQRRPVRHGRRGDRGAGRPAGRVLERHRSRAAGRPDGQRPTVAVLVRARKQLPGIAAALRERGLPVEVVGLGGLLEVPEVSDVVATLTVLVDPTAGDALGRLLTGARWRIGPARPRGAGGPRPRARPRTPAGSRRGAGRRRRAAVRAAGRARQHRRGARRPRRPRRLLGGRLPAAPARSARSSATCARRLSESLPDLVDEVARTLGLETELASAPGVSPAGARAHLDALHGVAAEFTELAELPSLPAFLGYLRDAEERERGPGAGRGGGQPGGGPAAHRALEQGAGVGRRRRPGHDQGPVPGQGRHQRLLDQGPGRGPRRTAAHRPRRSCPSCGCPCPAPATRRS